MSAIKHFKELSDQTKFHLSMWSFAVIIIVSVAVILSVLSINRFHNFQNEITELVKTSAIATSREIEATVYELQRDVAVFAAEYAEILAKIYEEKDTKSIEYQNLISMLEKRIPNMATYTITNEDGTEILDAFKSDVGDVCRIDVQDFVLNSYKQNIRIHPGHSNYHFDIMIPFVGLNNKILVFVVSFLPNDLIRILNNYYNPNYELVVTNSVHSNLIEISKYGTRQSISAPYYIENKKLSYIEPISNSSWEVAVILKHNLFYNHIKSIIADAVIMFLLFLTACTPMFIMIQRQANKRYQAVLALKNSESHFYDLYEHAPDMYMTVSKSGEILSANRHARDNFSIMPNAALKYNLFNFIHNDDVKKIKRLIGNIFDCQTLESEINFRCNDDSNQTKYIQAKLRLTPVTEGHNRSLRIVCRDVTKDTIRSRNKLAHLAEQRDTLVKEIHHRIKNNLHNVISLLKTYSRKDPSLAPTIQDASSKIASISEVYGLQGSGTTDGILLSELVLAIIKNEEKLFLSTINLSLDDEVKNDGILIPQEATPIAVIISELITNAIKYGNKSAGVASVHVNISRVFNSIKIEVRNKIDDNYNSPFLDSFSTGQGIELMRSLLPPDGAALQHNQINGYMVASLVLDAPEVVYFKEEPQMIFASNK